MMWQQLRSRATQVTVIAVGAAVGLSLGWLAISGIDWGRVQDALRNVEWPLLLAAGVLLFLSYYLRAMRWRVLWTTTPVGVNRLLVVELASLGLNNVSPVRALDEPVQFGILALRDRQPPGTVIATMLVSRILDLAFTLLFIALAVWALPSVRQFTPAIGGIVVYFVLWLAVFLNLRRIIQHLPVLRKIPGVLSLESAMESIKGQRMRVATSFFLTAAYWLLLGPVGWLIAKGVGVDTPIYEMLFTVIGAIFFATAVPGLPAAMGTFQFAVVELLGLFGVGHEVALSFSIILHTMLFLPPAIFTVLVLPREGVGSIGDLRRFMAWVREMRRQQETPGPPRPPPPQAPPQPGGE